MREKVLTRVTMAAVLHEQGHNHTPGCAYALLCSAILP
jgi:hypothetical protein